MQSPNGIEHSDASMANVLVDHYCDVKEIKNGMDLKVQRLMSFVYNNNCIQQCRMQTKMWNNFIQLNVNH